MIIGKINDDVYIDDAVLRETKQKVVINNQQITDLETFNKVVDNIEEKDKEIDRLNNIINETKKIVDYYGITPDVNDDITTRSILKQINDKLELKEGK